MKPEIAFAVLLSFAATEIRAQDAKADLEKLQGTWDIVAMERFGRSAPKEHCQNLKLTVTGDTMILADKNGFGPDLKHTIKLDVSKKPKVMDLVVLEGGGKGNVLRGIYEFDGKLLKMCHADSGEKKYPTEFRAPADAFYTVVIVTRTKQ